MNCDRIFKRQPNLGRKHLAGQRFGHRWFSWLAVLGIAIGVGLSGLPASAAPSPDGTLRTQTVDELFNSESTAGQSDRSTDGAISYGARQIVSDARLAERLTENSNADIEAKSVAASAKKHHLPTIVIGLIAIGAMLVLGAVVLLFWTRIVHRREMHNAPSPMVFNHPRI